MDWMTVIDKYYPAGTQLRDIYLRHCRSVATEAIGIARRLNLPLEVSMIEGAAMTHDIGIVATDAPSLHCHGKSPYICHGIIGASMLRNEGAPEQWAAVAERHTGSGLAAAEIATARLPLPVRDFLPVTLLERLICYADKFYSKSGDMQRKSIQSVRRGMERFGADSLARFERLHEEFG